MSRLRKMYPLRRRHKKLKTRGGGAPWSMSPPATRGLRRPRPTWAFHFNFPQRTIRIQALLRLDEGRSPAGDNPDLSVGRLLANQWRNDAGNAAKFHLQNEKRRFVRGANDGKFVLALGYDREFHEPRLRCSRQVGH